MEELKQLAQTLGRKSYHTHLKRHLIQTGDYKAINLLSYDLYKANLDGDVDAIDNCKYIIATIEKSAPQDYLLVARNLNSGRAKKSKNIKQRIQSMLNQGRAYFLTLTFNDETLSQTNDKTRRKYVSRLLKATNTVYLANIDFGEDNGREHYHAVTLNPITPTDWPYGFIKVKQIGRRDNEPVKIGKYITKLNNHALKVSTNGQARFNTIIYSRTKKGE